MRLTVAVAALCLVQSLVQSFKPLRVSIVGHEAVSTRTLKLEKSRCLSPTRLFLSENGAGLIVKEKVDADFVRTWYLKKFNQRPDVNIHDGAACGMPELLSEIWKSVLVSVRVMEKDQDMAQYKALTVFPDMAGSLDITDSEILASIESMVEGIDEAQPSLLLQPNFKRELRCHVLPASERNEKPLLVLEVDTRREYKPTPDFSDIDDFVPSVEDALNNDIEDFPFPTVYDFISEINRPPDAATMSELKFNYKIYDFKYDLTAMAKKKNPQDVVDNINCKLTRLAKWRAILEKANEAQTDAFSDTLTWSQEVKLKYQSLKAIAATDTKMALDTQYDKRKVFVNIIDQWSDRLKRSFKFTFYQSSREPENFNEAVMNSQWRNDFAKTVKLLAKAPFMDFEGPDFEPGVVQPMFADDRVLLWDSNYKVDVALSEIFAWIDHIDKAKKIAGQPTIGLIKQHTYSRGMITERVLTDTFKGLTEWLSGTVDKKYEVPEWQTDPEEYAKTHHNVFKTGVAGVNRISREKSLKELSGVKEMFQDAFTSGKEIVEWWTSIVRNLDKSSDMEAIANDRTDPWSGIIEDVITDPGAADATESVSVKAAQEMAEKNVKMWRASYKDVVLTAEEIESYLKWKTAPSTLQFEEFASLLQEQSALGGETISITFDVPTDSFLFVAPRYFRGIGMDEELSAFTEYSRLVQKTIESPSFLQLSGLAAKDMHLRITSLHPLMLTETGSPDYGRRAPHPSLLFEVVAN